MLFDVRSLDDEITSNNLGQYLSGFLIFVNLRQLIPSVLSY